MEARRGGDGGGWGLRRMGRGGREMCGVRLGRGERVEEEREERDGIGRAGRQLL